MHFEEVPHVVEGLLPVGLTVFAAPPKTGKSWFCLALSEAVAHGRLFFGRKTLKGDVLYLDLESRDVRVQGRMQRMEFAPAENLDIAFKAADLQSSLLDQLEAWRKGHAEARLIIVDTFARVKGAAQRNADAYSADSRLLSPLQSWALNNNVAVILVTHLRKQTRYAADADPFELITGSNGQFGIADTAWLVTGQRSDEQRHLVISGRDLEAQDLIMAFDTKNCRWRCLGDAETVQRTQEIRSPIVRTVLALLDESACNFINITAQDLLNQSVQRFGSTECGAPSALGRHLKTLAPTLDSVGIRYESPTNGGRKGRLHRFVRTT